MKYLAAISALIFGFSTLLSGQSQIVKDFTPACDSLAVLYSDYCGVKGSLKLKSVMKRKKNLDFYFTETLGDYPFYNGDIKWFRAQLKALFPEQYSNYYLGEIYTRNVNVSRLELPRLTKDGNPARNSFRVHDNAKNRAIVTELHATYPEKGLKGRHIALWQSHGRYFDQGAQQWLWQRPCLFQTCEDMFTQGFVLPYLVPMLENAGAYLLMPRERDIQHHEIIADNDTTCVVRGKAIYTETGKWTDAGTGFADPKDIYLDLENPFTMGTARQVQTVSSSTKPTASITWTPEIPERGEYAVYVSYKSLPTSSNAAHYTVRHLGGTSEYAVNQKIGGGTWIYLGTFEFEEGTQGAVILDNTTPKGIKAAGTTITADAVRFGGGMGNIARARKPDPNDSTTVVQMPVTSGLPRSAEAARYWLQWAGADTTVYYQNQGKNDYKDDFMSRGDWVEWISRGSRVNPSEEGGMGIPVDLSFGFHTDAGITPDDSLIGTLAIYTYKSESKTTLPNSEDRMSSRMYADIIQSQIVSDLRSEYDSLWTRRSIWDRAYRESRTPSCPAMILELLSHQNFADMKAGLDPAFRFTVSRAVYKGILKYLSNRFGCDYAVQPLPVSHLASEFESANKVSISWKPVHDPLEPTAVPTGYIVYKRTGNGVFDKGTKVTDLGVDSGGHIRFWTEIPLGEVVSFKVVAYNDGGMSFPSETVSIGIPHNGQTDSTVLIVNNFDRISGPAWYDSGNRAGFDSRVDNGVGYIREITNVGEMYNFSRADQWVTNERPGFGASYSDMAGSVIAGNTFDYASVHGKAMLEAGYPFHSCSNERFVSDQYIHVKDWTVDLVCGKQIKTPAGNNIRYEVFPREMQRAINEFVSIGGNILVSGAYIGTDLQDSIYPIQKDSTSCEIAEEFAADVLGYKFITNQASRKGKVIPVVNKLRLDPDAVQIVTEPNSDIYCIESPDGIAPASTSGHIIYRYADSGISAGVATECNGYRCIALGFPIEALSGQEMINSIIETSLEYFRK